MAALEELLRRELSGLAQSAEHDVPAGADEPAVHHVVVDRLPLHAWHFEVVRDPLTQQLVGLNASPVREVNL